MSMATLEKWLVDRCTVLAPELVAVSGTKRKVDSEPTIASGVHCRFDVGSGGLVETMLGQQRRVSNKLFIAPEPVVKPTHRVRNEATGETWTVTTVFQYPATLHQEATIERAATA